MTENAVAERTESGTEVASRSPSTTMALITEAVKNGLPMETIRELREMAKEEAREIAEQAFNDAMRAAQEEMEPIAAETRNKQTNSNYATYAALDRVLRPIYTKHGFSISYDEGDTDKPDHIRVLAYVSHSAGFTRTYRKDLPADGKGPKGGDVMTKTHAAGAADSYGMRYLLKKIWNVAVGEDDRDGNDPADMKPVDQDQLRVIRGLLEQTGSDIERFCNYFKIEALPDLPATKFESAKKMLEAKGASS